MSTGAKVVTAKHKKSRKRKRSLSLRSSDSLVPVVPPFPETTALRTQLVAVLLPRLMEHSLIQWIADYAQWYLRADGDSARIEYFENDDHPDNDDDEKVNALVRRHKLRVGDLILERNGYRHTRGRVVGRADVTSSVCDDSGYGRVPKSVSQWIENPVTFYSEALSSIRHFHTVELHAWAHQHLLREAAGDRPVSVRRTVFVSDRDTDEPSIMLIGPVSPDVNQQWGFGKTVLLNRDTPDEYLSDHEQLQSDPVVERQRNRNRQIHEVDAHAYFRSLASGTMLSICGPPNLDGHERGGSDWFDRCQLDPSDPTRVLSVACRDGGVYRPTVTIEHGPFAGVKTWVTEPRIAPGRGYHDRDMIYLCRNSDGRVCSCFC